MTKLIIDGREIDVPPEDARSAPASGHTSRLDELLDELEKMSPEERRRDIERAETFLRANCIDSLEQFDRWMKR